MTPGEGRPRQLAGRLLVATPGLRDRNFYRTVVLLLDHGADGALGVVLNRPSETDVDEALPQWHRQVAAPPVVFVGGPVALTSAICLAHADGDGADGWQPLFGRLGTLDLGVAPDEVGVAVDTLRVFAGYAGWGTGQLEDEIAAGGWYVVDAEPADALTPSPETLWRRVLRRQRGMLSVIANYPKDLSAN